MTNPRETVGVIAGAGQFPLMVVAGAHRAGHRVVVAGLDGFADGQLSVQADVYRPVGLLRIGSWIRFFRRQGVSRATMAGFVRKSDMYGRFAVLKLLPDWLFLKLWFLQLPDRRNDTVLAAVADVLEQAGVTLEDVTRYCQEALAQEGVLCGPEPSRDLRRDIAFAWPIVKQMGELDIGQSIAVKDVEVIAVEAIEGTDRMIERAGQLCPKGGWTLVKAAKPSQDMRFDVPTIGPDTINNLHRHGATVLVVEAGKTVIVEKDQTFELAARHGVTIIGLSPTGQSLALE